MRQDDRAPFDRVLRARRSAYGPGEFVGQERFIIAIRRPDGAPSCAQRVLDDHAEAVYARVGSGCQIDDEPPR
jgi:hypothetical protein